MRPDPLLDALIRHHPEKAPPHLLARRREQADKQRAEPHQPAPARPRPAQVTLAPPQVALAGLSLSVSFAMPLRPLGAASGLPPGDGAGIPAPLPASILAIVKEVSQRSGISISRLRGPERARDVSLARHYVMWRARNEAGLSLPRIARLLGRCDHTTALHGVRRIDRMRQSGELKPALRKLYGNRRRASAESGGGA